MPFDRAALPRDPERLIDIILELQDENARLRAIVATLERVVYGPRSERLAVDARQLPLALNDVVITAGPAANDDAAPAKTATVRLLRAKPARNIGALPKHLPRYEVVLEPESKLCPCCHGSLHRIGEDVSEQLDVLPAMLQVRRTRRPRYGCRSCEGAVVQVKAPPRLLENGMPTTELVASIVAAKFAWHLPLHRQTQMLRGQGISLHRSTLVHWVLRAAWWLKPLYTLLVETVLAAPKVFCDDTPLPVLDRQRHHTRTARFWSYAVDDRPWQGPAAPAVVYLYAEDRKGQHVHEHLADFRGVLQVDAYAGYSRLTKPERPGGPITLAFCLAHARRKFWELYKQSGSPVAEEALRQIQAVYAIEARIRGRPAAERVAVRQVETKPVLAVFKTWLMQHLTEESKKSSLARAIRYTLGHWRGLILFLGDGRIEVGRVDDRRGRCSLPVGDWRRFRSAPSVRADMAPFPVAAHRTGRADFPHPALSRPVRPSLSAGRRVAAGRYRGRVSHRDTRLGSGGTQRLVVPHGASTSGGRVAQCMRERAHRFL